MKQLISIFCLVTVLLVNGCSKYEETKNESVVSNPQVPVQVSTSNTDSAEPAVSVATDGSSYVVWVEHRPGGKADVYLKKLDTENPNGRPPVRVNPEEGKATAWRGDPPSVAVAPDNAIYVGWTGRETEKGHDTNLYLSASRDGGKTFGAPLKVNDDVAPARHGMHSLAVDNNGRIYLAWLDERNTSRVPPAATSGGKAHEMESNNELFTAFSADGGRTISRNQLIARETCPCCKTAITTAPDGRVYIAWRQVLKGDYRHIALTTSGDNGATYSPPAVVSDDQWVIAGCPVSGPSLSVREDGQLQVLWYTEGDAGAQGLYITSSKDQGQTFSSRQLIAKGVVRGNPIVVSRAKDKGSIAIWNGDGTNLKRAEILSDGSIKEGITTITTGELPSAAASNDQISVAYIATINKQRSIWLYRTQKSTVVAKQ